MKKKLMTMVIAAGAMLGAWADLAGSGTKAAPYRIGNYAELVAFAAKVNGGETTAWAVLTADVKATGTDWMPIGSYETENRLHHVEYKGVFDGQGHTIANLSNAGFTDEKRGRGGLFYSLGSGGIVKNVQLTNINISSRENVGAVVDNCKPGSTVENCEVSGSVSGNNIVGGVVGYALSDSVVRNCRVVCTVTSGASGPSGEIGGIVGITYGTIADCVAECTLISGNHIGGIAGNMSGGATVTNCEVQCTVQGCEAGGIVGYCGDSGSTVADCRSSGTVKGCDSAGGIVGYCFRMTVRACRASCDVTSTATGNYDHPYIGGIVARMDYGCVANCEAAGTLTGTSKAYAGGIIGYASKCPLEKCSSSCTVSGGYNVGGIVGQGHKSPIRNCYNTGSVTATVSDEYTTAGGIVGYNLYDVVENCYNTGAVSGTTPKTGGIVGCNYGRTYDDEDEAAEVLHSYALAGSAGGVLVGEESGFSTLTDVRTLSAAEFTVKANFVGWDFMNVWKMGENAPKLRTNYDVTYDENWAGGGTTTKELFKGDGILANAPADPKREGWYFCGWFTESEGGLKVTGATVADGDATYYARWGKPVATFAAGAVSSSESKTVKVTINGGSLTGPSSVKVFMTYQTAAAADLDLANATVNGVKVKGGLKFPLTLAWDTADVTPYTIEIPLKGDKQVEDDETLTFQLADVIGTEMGETDVSTVTVEDPAFDELRGRIETGTATKAESNSWIKVSHDGIPYFRGLPYPADGGKATGSGYCPANKKVTLKVTANKGFTFLGWTTNAARSVIAPYPDGYFVATTASLVIDRTAKPAKDTKASTTISNLTESTTFYAVFEGDPRVSATPVEFTEDGGVVATDGGKVTGAGRYEPGKKVTLKATANKGFVFGGWYETGNREEGIGNSDEDGLISQQASYSFEMGEEDVDLYARFVTTVEDEASIRLVLNGTEMSANPAAVPSATNYCGVAVDWQVAASALSATTVKAAGLPAGVKLVQDKETGVWSLLGAPTAASKAGKDGNLVPSRVKLTVTTAGKSSATYAFDWTILPLPAWTVGLFEGFAATTTTPEEFGPASMSATAAGKVSGKFSILGTNWTFKADSYVDNGIGGPGIDEDGVHFVYVDATATAGKAVRKMIIMVIPFGLDLCPDSAISYCHGIVLKEGVDSMQSESDAEWQLLMYRIPWADKGDTVAASVVASYAGAYSCTAQYGTETCPVTFTLDEKGVIKGTVEVTDGNKARKVSFSTHALPYYDPDGLSAFIVIPADLKKGYPEIFAYCELVNHYGKPKAEKAYRNPGVIASSAAYDNPAAAGTVSVSPKYGQAAAGKEVTLTAKAASGSVFSHWEIAGADIDGLDLASPKLKVVAPGDADVSATAVFVTVAEDAGYIHLFVDGAELPPSPAEEVPKLSAEQGSPVSWPVETWTHSAATVKASGLPKGLKLVQDKTTKEYSVAGTPTAPSKKDAGGEYVPSVAKFTVTTAGKSSETFELAIVVVPTVE